MARNWISVRKNLRDDPRLLSIAAGLGVSRNEALGALVLWFMWVDENSADGVVENATPELIDSKYVTDQSGLFAELLRIGWATLADTGRITVTNFDDHMSESAKRRKQDQERKALARKKPGVSSAKCPQGERTEGGPHNRDRDRDNTKKKGRAAAPPFDWADVPDGFDTPEVRATLDEWQGYRSETKRDRWKPVTIRKSFRAFAAAGCGPSEWVAAVERSMANGYQGVFPPDQPRAKTSGRESGYDFDSLKGVTS